MMSLERNVILEKDLVKVKDDLNKSLKWATSSKFLSDMTNQMSNEKRGLGYVDKIDPPYDPHRKYVSVSDNLRSLQTPCSIMTSTC